MITSIVPLTELAKNEWNSIQLSTKTYFLERKRRQPNDVIEPGAQPISGSLRLGLFGRIFPMKPTNQKPPPVFRFSSAKLASFRKRGNPQCFLHFSLSLSLSLSREPLALFLLFYASKKKYRAPLISLAAFGVSTLKNGPLFFSH